MKSFSYNQLTTAFFVFGLCSQALSCCATDPTDLALLAQQNPALHIYRLHVVRSFHPELLFEFEIFQDGRATLTTKKFRLESNGGVLASSKIIKNSTIECTSEQANSFENLVGKSEIWTLPPLGVTDYDPKTALPREEPILVTDGSTWTFECVMEGKYKKIERQNPIDIRSIANGELINEMPPDLVFREGILISACIWLWVLGDEIEQPIY